MRTVRAFLALASVICASQAQVIDVKGGYKLNVSSTPGLETIPYQYGVMFEDINHSGDGGIYAELIQNRAFQAVSFAEASIYPWLSVGNSVLSLKNINSLSTALPNYVNVALPAGYTSGQVGLANPGWWGISVLKQTYTGSFYVMGAYNGKFTMTLGSSTTSATYATTTVSAITSSNKWTQIEYTLTPNKKAPNSNNTLYITFDGKKAADGCLNFNLISLFPPTYNHRPNGMRPELMTALSQLSPSYLRMPGGNNIEGITSSAGGSGRWIWNNTIGPLIDRPGRMGTWGYYNTDGLGLHEYFDWCEDLDMEPVYAVWSGLYLDGEIISQDQLQPYIDEALNAIEYITGDTSTYWGALRASNGRSDPWPLKYVEVGNEDFLNGGYDSYLNYRFPMFYDAINAAFPEITVMSSFTGFDVAPGVIQDYHIYTRPDDFVGRYHQSDYAGTVNPAMVGEFACTNFNTPGGGGADFGNLNLWPFWAGSVAEVVYLLGLEVNAATIFGASYAPTLQNLNSFEWNTNMISFQADPSLTVLSTSWHTLKLLSNTRFTQTRKVSSNYAAGPIYWAAGLNENTGSYIMKLVSYNTTAGVSIPMSIAFPDVVQGATANLTIMTAPDGLSHSSVGVDPVKSTMKSIAAGEDGVFTFTMPNYAVVVLATYPKGYPGTTGDKTGFAGFGGFTGCHGGRSKSSEFNGC